MEPADHDDAEDGNEDEEGDISAALEKWRGAADPDQRPDVADPAEMRGYIDRHGDVKRHHRNIQRGAITAETDPDRGRDRNLSETAGNWPGTDETLQTKCESQHSIRLVVITGTVEESSSGPLATDEHDQRRLTHVAKGTDKSALEAFYERCEAMNYEVLDEPTVERISLEELLASVNDPEMNLGEETVKSDQAFE